MTHKNVKKKTKQKKLNKKLHRAELFTITEC